MQHIEINGALRQTSLQSAGNFPGIISTEAKYSLGVGNSIKICQILHIQSGNEFKNIHGAQYYIHLVYFGGQVARFSKQEFGHPDTFEFWINNIFNISVFHVLRDQLSHIKNFKSLFKQNSIQIGQHQSVHG